MSQGVPCTCPGTRAQRSEHWRIVDYRCNYSHFSGGRRTPSAYSAMRCQKCEARWRTRAGYVDAIYKRDFGPQAPEKARRHGPENPRQPYRHLMIKSPRGRR
jgi:tRNA(Ile2) C34 agmatinyltransferase TiaS